MYHIQKFGGQILSNSNGLDKISNLIVKGKINILIVSALNEITNYLSNINEIDKGVDTIISHLYNVHSNFLNFKSTLVNEHLKEFKEILNSYTNLGILSAKEKAEIISYGEKLSAIVLYEYLCNNKGYRCKILLPELFLFTNSNYLNAEINIKMSKKKFNELNLMIEYDEIRIIPGFYGIDNNSDITLLGRSGTDYTASAVANFTNSNVHIWKNTDGFMTADPEVVHNATIISSLSYNEAEELSNYGARILHPRTIYPLRENNLKLIIKNFMKVDRFTLIGDNSEYFGIKSVTYKKNLILLKLKINNGFNINGIINKITEELNKLPIVIRSIGISYSMMSLVLDNKRINEILKIISKIGFIENFRCVNDIVLLSLVGCNINDKPGILSKYILELANQNINIEFLSSGTSSSTIQLCIVEKNFQKGIEIIHNQIEQLEVYT